MRFTKQLQTVAVLAVGAVFGYLTASGEPTGSARNVADAASVRSLPTQAASATTAKAACCDAKLDRTLALANTVTEANTVALAQVEKATKAGKKPNILVIWGDDIGYWNVSMNNQGMMGYKTPNSDRIAKEGANFTDWYGQQSC
ncbi:MAG: arylsulfatase, partial [Planctomycetia bacterium]|nr:arylsulfatase [Planctomycetia bacterium]